MSLQHLRSSTANKRPVPGNMSEGQLALNSNNGSPGLFFRDSNSNLVKVGPVHVGTTAPNASPAVGGTAGNSVGEQWLDTTGGTYVFKVWDGSAWRSESGTFVDVNGDVMTGALGIIAGSAATPGLYFSGDTNTGIYSPGADQLALATGGSGRLFIGSTGSVGVGVSSPAVDFHVANASGGRIRVGGAAGAGVEFNGSDTRIDIPAANTLAAYTNSLERLRVTSAGLVGVGTSTPGTIGGGATVSIAPTGGGRVVIGSPNRYFYITGASGTEDLRIGRRITSDTVDSDIITILGSSGNVGIGTTSPGLPLQVVGTIGTTPASTNSGFLLLSGNSGAAAGCTIESSFTSGGYGPLLFKVNNGEAARIDSSGRLLVGTSSGSGIRNQQNASFVVTGDMTYGGALFAGYSGTTFTDAAPNLDICRSRGTSAGSFTKVENGDRLGGLNFRGADGTGFIDAASIVASVDGGTGANDMPGRLVFSTTADGASSPTERMRITQDGYVRLSASSPGLQFNGDTAAANALDDYEEGTFTPTVTGSSTAGTGTYNTNGQVGRYTKIGNRVSFTIYVDWSAHTGTGNLRVSGLPFTSNSAANAFNAVALYAGSLTYTGPMLQAYFGSASTTIIVGQMTAAGVTSGVPMDTAANLTLSGHYEV